MVWDKTTGEPVYNAIVWQDTRTQPIVDELAADGGVERFKQKVGLPLATYFSGTKIKWILDNVDGARAKAEAGDLLFGNTDTWVLWNLTGGTDGGVHVTDVTNASRTMFMDLETLQLGRGDPGRLRRARRPCCPRSSPPPRSTARCTPRSCCARCRSPASWATSRRRRSARPRSTTGEAKNTYGTGNFLIFNTGEEIVHSKNGLLTTVGYKLGDAQAALRAGGLHRRHRFAGPVAARQPRHDQHRRRRSRRWRRRSRTTAACTSCRRSPGLFAPYWRSDARGAIVGLTRFVNKGHIARAALEATAFQTREVLDAVNADSGVPLTELKVDGGMVANDALMQFQADILGVPVIRPKVAETTALGAAYAAGLAVGFWKDLDELRPTGRRTSAGSRRWTQAERDRQMRLWKKAVTKSFDWVDEDVK